MFKTVFKYQKLFSYFGKKPFKILDIGCTNGNPSKTKSNFPNCEYHGVDMVDEYVQGDSNKSAMQAFYLIDLTTLQFDTIPNNYFDAIVMAHVIEHLHNGDEVIQHLIPKLKQGGVIYIEYPREKSTTFPSKYGTLNFYDDPTHVRIYHVSEITTILKDNNFSVLSSGVRRNWVYILGFPIHALISLVKYKKIVGPIYWDIYGFAEFFFAKKN